MRDTIEPTIEQLFGALEPLRAEPDEFAAGVARRIEESDDEDGADTLARTTSSWPRWLRRAAMIAPAGSLKTLGLLKGAPGAKAGSAVVGVTWAAPLAAIAVGAAGIFAATFRLRADRADEHRQPFDLQTVRALGWVAVAVVCGLALFGLVRNPAWIGPTVGALQFVAVITVARVLSSLGRASRATLAGVFASLFLEVGTFQMFLLPGVPYAKRLVPSVILGVAGLVLFVVARRSGWRGLSRWQFITQSAIFVLAGGFYYIAIAPVPFGSDARALVAWGNSVDRPIDDLSSWENLGRLRVALSPEEFADLDTARLARAVADAEPRSKSGIHPISFGAALRLDILPPSEFGENTSATWSRRPSFSRVGFTYLGDARLHMADAKARGIFEGDLRGQARVMLDATWPEAGEFQSLVDAADVLEAAEFAGFDDMIDRRLAEVPAILEAAWLGRRSPPWADAGFEPLNRDDDGELPPAQYAASTEYAFAASRLIARLASDAPEMLETLDVDLGSFLRYLDEERRQSRLHRVHPYRIEAALARHLLLRSVDVPARPPALWLAGNALVMGAIASVLIAFAATLRARTGTPVWDGP